MAYRPHTRRQATVLARPDVVFAATVGALIVLGLIARAIGLLPLF